MSERRARTGRAHTTMLTDILLVFALILLNGLFAMPEIAIVTSRRVRLLQMAENGRAGAQHALQLASEPTKFPVECSGGYQQYRHPQRRDR